LKSSTVIRTVLLLAVAMIVMIGASGCGWFSRQRLEAGTVGVKYNVTGAKKGVTSADVVRGKVWYNSFSESIYPFPTAPKRIVWNSDMSGDDGAAKLDQSIPVSSKDGVAMFLDIAVTYYVEEEMVPQLFSVYKKDADSILTGVMRDKVRKALGTASANLTAMELRVVNQDKFLGDVTDKINESVKKEGFRFKELAFTGRPRFADPKMEEAIGKVMQAKLDAQAANEKVEQTKAEARQKYEQAAGEARANAALAASLSDKNIKWQQIQNQAKSIENQKLAIDKWNGQLPATVLGNNTPFVNITPGS
jgi:regulator of protease activity HflC (stomatin/prohibitin superfamily)